MEQTGRIEDGRWRDDESLAEDLRNYVFKNFNRSVIPDFMRRDYPSYNWSIATLDKRLRLTSLIYFTLMMIRQWKQFKKQ